MRFNVPYITWFPEIWIEKPPNLRFHMIWLEYEIKKSNQFWDTRLPMPIFIHHKIVKRHHDDPSYQTLDLESIVSMWFERKILMLCNVSSFSTFSLLENTCSIIFMHFPIVDKVARIATISCWFVIARWYLPLPSHQIPLASSQWFVSDFCHAFLGHVPSLPERNPKKKLGGKKRS